MNRIKIENVSLKDLSVYQSSVNADYYIIGDKKNNLYHFFNNYYGILSVSGNFDLYVGSIFTRKGLLNCVKNVYTSRRGIKEHEYRSFQLSKSHQQLDMGYEVHSSKCDTPYNLFTSEELPCD